MVGQLRQLNSKDMKRVKTNFDSTKGKAIRVAINKELAAVHYINKVAVDIYGKIYYLDEAHIRALQVVAAKLAATDKEAFEDFKKNVVVYSGRDITHSSHVMYWQDNGKFIRTFQKGFYTANDYLVEELYNI
jgi:stalled ribosome rescue protein Dom34